MHHSPSTRPGQSIVELIVALGISALIVPSFARMSLGSFDTTRQAREQTAAAFYAQEGLEAVHSIREQGWNNLIDGTHGLIVNGGKFALSGGSDTNGKFTRTVAIGTAYRSSTGMLVAVGGTNDTDTKEVTSSVTWNVQDGRENTVSLLTYLTHWAVKFWTQTVFSEFLKGARNSVSVVQVSDGEVTLAAQGDWSRPEVFFTTGVSGGNTNANDVAVDQENGVLYAVTDSNGGIRKEFFAYDLSNASSGSALPALWSLELGDDAQGLFVDTASAKAYVASKNTTDLFTVNLAARAVTSCDVGNSTKANDVAFAGGKAYLAKDSSAQQELYVVNPSSCTVTGTGELSVDVNAIAISGSYLYLATSGNSAELKVINLNNLATVYNGDATGNGDANDVILRNGFAYVVTNDDGASPDLHVFDVHTPTLPIEVQSLSLSTDALSISLNDTGDEAYITTTAGTEELMVITLPGNPALFPPVKRGSVNLNGAVNANASVPLGALLYVASNKDGDELQVIRGNLGGWYGPQEMGNGSTPGNIDALTIAYSGSLIFVGTANNAASAEFYVFNAAAPTPGMLPMSSIEIGEDVNDIVLANGYAYLATSHDTKELTVVDVRNPASLSIAGTYDADPGEGPNALAVTVSGTGAYLGTVNNAGAGDHEFYVLDISNKTSIQKEGGYDLTYAVNDSVSDGSYAYLATPDNTNELVILNVTKPGNISQVGTVNLTGTADANALILRSPYLYMVTDDGGANPDFFIFSLSNPTAPGIAGSLDLGSSNTGLAVDMQTGKYAFVSSGKAAEELQILDISTPGTPRNIRSRDMDGNGTDVATNATYVAFASDSNPQELQIVGKGVTVNGFARWGIFLSDSFDSSSSATQWKWVRWTKSGTGGSIALQLRTALTKMELATATWVGPDGTSATKYQIASGTSITTAPGTNTEWIQWKAYLTGTGTFTPSLEDVTIDYD